MKIERSRRDLVGHAGFVVQKWLKCGKIWYVLSEYNIFRLHSEKGCAIIKSKMVKRLGGESMAQLSDSIEQFIKELMCEEAHIELRRNELAQHFGCAPSQINYVLATRFSVDHGYIIESRRGGGGYVRIVRMQERAEGNLLEALLKRVGNSVDEDTAGAIITHLTDLKLVTGNEGALMRSAVSRNALALPISAKDVLRAAVLRNMLVQVFRNIEGGDQK